MTNFEQLNDSELVALSEEQITHYIKVKKAETGIKIITLPEYPKLQETPEPDMEMYRVAGWVFAERAKAEEIASVINSHLSSSFTEDYDYYRGGSDFKYAKPFSGNIEQVEITRLYSQTLYNSIKDIIQSNKKIEESYKKIKSEYDEEESRASEIIDTIYDAISAARERIEKFKNYKSRIIEYLRLANGDRDIAWNFFDKAYSVEPSVKAMIMESQEYQDAVNSYINS